MTPWSRHRARVQYKWASEQAEVLRQALEQRAHDAADAIGSGATTHIRFTPDGVQQYGVSLPLETAEQLVLWLKDPTRAMGGKGGDKS